MTTPETPSETRPMMSRAILPALGLAAAGLFLAGWLRARPDTIDDAYITFRYIDNLLSGRGLSFNPGQIVEGYSNPLFLFLLVPFQAAGISPEAAAAGIGLLSFAFCVIAAARLVRLLGGAPWQVVLAAILTFGHFPLLYYSVTGLETGFYAALIAGALWRYAAAGGRVDAAGAALWTGVALCRPEGILFPAALGVHETVGWLGEGRGSGRRARSMGWLLGVAGMFALFLFWRRWYFGAWLPNTFTAKPPGTAGLAPARAGAGASVRYLLGFLWQMGVLLPLAALWTLRKETRRTVSAPWSVVAAGLLFGLYTGGDWMPASRYLLPIFVPLLALGIAGVVALAWSLERSIRRRGLARALPLAAAVAALAAPAVVLHAFFVLRPYNPYHILNAESCKSAALAIRERYGTDTKVVTHRIGALGQFSGMEVIDLFGLVDATIAEIVAANPRYHPIPNWGSDVPALSEYVAARRPDLILVINYGAGFAPAIRIYGFKFLHRGTFVLGADERWELYERAG